MFSIRRINFWREKFIYRANFVFKIVIVDCVIDSICVNDLNCSTSFAYICENITTQFIYHLKLLIH
jgi:hypothetical protein